MRGSSEKKLKCRDEIELTLPSSERLSDEPLAPVDPEEWRTEELNCIPNHQNEVFGTEHKNAPGYYPATTNCKFLGVKHNLRYKRVTTPSNYKHPQKEHATATNPFLGEPLKLVLHLEVWNPYTL
jgi:hypothetical protein